MSSSAWQNETIVQSFLNGTRAAIPYAADQLNIMLYLLDHLEIPVNTFIDLGAGDGILSHLILDKYKNAKGYLIDFSEPMINAAVIRLADYKDRVTMINGDINKSNWQDLIFGESLRGVNAIVSGYCIHHMTDERKYQIYQEIYTRLSPDGIFINIEHVSPKTPWIENIYSDLTVDSLYSYEVLKENPKSKEEVSRIYRSRPDKDENKLLSVEKQCDWLREIGFKNVDVNFKIFEMAVFSGTK